ncbi:hydantoinase B/oxoprolinase family protein [Pigmentiphaga litoralis]|uniref:N-methylhydantoinase B n=1 Tax=Pigmentiphaga litoralis TaxID=516702 RepID=A0A7Y9LMD4_9BURK|nr:hydantoinase B/oxoprolinase family protein [Pigmentiphaga litoralis]NYE24830.1 N-methylhydantoinase B [Pigmentiphaga litoralis]NYE81556.1 N-methylhydantoinase B [Pigmentiphaga litoralis]
MTSPVESAGVLSADQDIPRPDAVLTEIVRNGVLAVTEEMKTNLMRTAYNMIIYEALDFTVGLFTARGETISIGIGLPSFIRGMANTVKEKLSRYGVDGIAPGDILVTNDAYITGSHLNHFTFSQPIFSGGQLTAWACCMAHWPDVGGSLGGPTSDIFSEGLQIPILKYSHAGRINEDLVDIIKANVRLPERAMGDLRAQIVAVTTGTKRFTELLDRYGRDNVLGAIANIMDRSEAAARARTRSIPDGVYEAESFMDDDGLQIGKHVPIKVRVIKCGDELTVDLSEVSPQVQGFFNSGPSTGYSCAQVAYKCLTSPTDYPINEGSFRPLKVIVPSGTVVSAVKPAAMRKWMTFPMTVVDTIFKAMVAAIPDRTIAAHHADLVITLFHGIAPVDGKFFIGFIGPTGGGWGAKHNGDGMSGVVCSNDGDTHNSPCEQLEAKYPILIERHALRPDSGGAGRFRGGLGTEVVVQARSTISVDIQADRMQCAPWGLEGGHAGLPNDVRVTMKGERGEETLAGKIRSQRLRAGDRLYLRAGGGGGFGPPEDRDPMAVVRDVRHGYVSAVAARDRYRVVLDDMGELDEVATIALRAS